MDLKRLKHLVALADERHFGRAAERVHLSQPAFSRSVQAVEAELGLVLFDRGSLEVTCTPAGAFVIERARKLLFDSRCLERDVGLYRERLIGDLALGVGPFPAVSMLPRLMTEMRTRFPGIQTRVEVNNWKYLLEHLRAEELDFFLADIRNVPADPDLSIQNIGRHHGGFYARVGHPLLAQDNPGAAALLLYGIASVRLPPEVSAMMAKLFGLSDGARFPLALECDDLNLLKRVALATDTVLASPADALIDELAAGKLKLIAVRDLPPLFAEMGVVSLKGRSYSASAEFSVRFLSQLVEAGPLDAARKAD